MLCGIGSRMIAATSWSVERALDLVGVVEAADDRRVDDLGEDPLRERVLLADVLGQRDHVHRDRVVPAVVAALELDDVPAAGRGAGDAQRVEGRLAAGLGQQHALDRRHERRTIFSASSTSIRVTPMPIRPTSFAAAATARVDVGVAVAEERRAEGGVVVGVGVALAVGERRAARRGDDEVLEPGHAALAAVHPARDHARRARRELCSFGLVGDRHLVPPLVDAVLRHHVLVERDAEAGLGRHGEEAVGVDRQPLAA